MNRRSNGEGTFVKRGKGWRYRVEVNGYRVTAEGRTRTEAKRAALERARLVAERPATGTVAQLVAEWVTLSPESVGLRQSTHDQYRYLLASKVTPAIGDVRLSALTRRRIADLVRGWDGAASTRRNTYAALVKVFDYAVASGVLAVNLARETPRPPQPQPGERAVDADAARRLLAASQGHRWGAAAWLSFGCGLRRGETLALRWSDVDLERGELMVRGNVTRTSAGLVRGTPKTRRGTRMVPIPAAVVAQLRAHRGAQTEQRLASVYWEDHDLVLTNEIGGLVEPRSFTRAWRQWAKAARLTDTGTHVGRHYAASTMLASGRASVADVAAALGHDPAVLLNTYAVAVASGQRAASDALGDSLAGGDLGPVFGPVVVRQ